MNDVAKAYPGPVAPHGGVLVNRELQDEELQRALARARAMPRIELDERELADVEMIGVGALSPLRGFMGRAEYESVVENMRLGSGLLWALPVTLATSTGKAAGIALGQEIALVDAGQVIAVMEVTDKFPYDKRHEAEAAFGTADADHPGVARIYRQGDVYLGGPIWVVKRPNQDQFAEFRLTPRQTRTIFDERGWRQVVAFQTRNPVHRAHEYIQKSALEIVDGLLLHPLVGATKSDDIPADVRMRTYQEILSRYYPADRVLLSVFPAAMRYGGPREAIWHAICRKNYGCTHFIVGRDHAGVGKYYGTFDAQKIFDRIPAGDLGVTILKFENSFYCTRCGNMATAKTCPHPEDDHLSLSGTRVRAMLREGEFPPPEFTRREVAEILIAAARDAASEER